MQANLFHGVPFVPQMSHHNETARASSLSQALKGPDIRDLKKLFYLLSSVHY